MAPAPARDDDYFAARMTGVQFEALACRCHPDSIRESLRTVVAARTMTQATRCDSAEVAKWLINGWSTEQLLATNARHLVADALRHSLHWAFPQAYYSVFAATLAYFKAIGYTETGHARVIRKFGAEAGADRYPSAIAFTATGPKPFTFSRLSRTHLKQTLDFVPSDQGLVDGQIAQFLRATREDDLRDKKKDVPIRTKRGIKKKALRTDEWRQVATALGPTSILSLLYRKRIKANYRDIDSFLHEGLEPVPLYEHILRVVGAINYVHEVFIARVMPPNFLESTLDRMPAGTAQRTRHRLRDVNAVARET